MTAYDKQLLAHAQTLGVPFRKEASGDSLIAEFLARFRIAEADGARNLLGNRTAIVIGGAAVGLLLVSVILWARIRRCRRRIEIGSRCGPHSGH
jgi:hypothetical protein